MANLSLHCPHCDAEKAAFELRAESAETKYDGKFYTVFLICRVCENGVIVRLAATGNPDTTPMNCGSDPTNLGWSLINVWPAPEVSRAPDSTPDNVAGFFLQGEESLRSRHYDAAGAMYRKALDTATLNIDPDLKGKKLYRRIEMLADRYAITPAMRDWAHEIRLMGNDAVHEEEPFTEQEAKDVQTFTQLFLTYVYTLPGMLAERQAAQSPP